MKTWALAALLLVQVAPTRPLGSGLVSGRLLTTEGLPAAKVRVAAMVVPESASSNTGTLVAITETDGDGRYLLANVPPGRVYITAGLIDSPTYYPGTLSASGATVVQVLAGRTIEKADFSMVADLKIKGVRISGRVVGVPSGSVGMAKVQLTLSGASRATFEVAVNPDETFEFPNVPPGTYAASLAGLPRLSPVGLGPNRNIQVGSVDVTGVQIPANFETDVTGRVTVVDENGLAIKDLVPSCTLVFTRTNGSAEMSLGRNGTFRIALLERDHTLSFKRLSPQFTVLSITSDGADLMKEPLRVDRNAPTPEIQVIMKYKP